MAVQTVAHNYICGPHMTWTSGQFALMDSGEVSHGLEWLSEQNVT